MQLPFAVNPCQSPKRADLHCHSDASNRTSEAVLNAIRCPESYSRPDEVYAQAKLRGMDFVTLTDHDSIEGALEISTRADVLVGEELTCWFPEDRCKMHVLVYGIGRDEHARLQSLSENIYDVAEFIEGNLIAHSVAHPIYRQNDKLERWHLERLLLLFKGFECLNGAHSPLHRQAFEPMLDRLTPQEIARLAETHHLAPRWPDPHVKARTAGSDDHGLLNVGRTYTEFPSDTTTVPHVLECLRTGACRPSGEEGSSAKLAHTFYSVAVRYYSRHLMTPATKPNLATVLLQTIAGERRAPSRGEMMRLALKSRVKRVTRRIVAPFAKPQAAQAPDAKFGTARLKKLFLDSSLKHFQQHPGLREILERGLPPLGEHEELLSLVSAVNREVTRGIATAIDRSIDEASFTGLFDSIGAAIAQQFVLLPYYFAVFHQNKERHLLRQITRQQRAKTAQTLKVGLFTDTFDEMNGVGRFLRDMQEQARRSGRELVVHTCSPSPRMAIRGLNRKNFEPLLSRPLPLYEELQLHLPPLLEILEWSDRQQFDAVHVSTPGPMGLCGWLVSRMLRVPLLATYHTDFPAYVDRLARDHRVTNGTIAYMKWFYGQTSAVFSRSSAYLFNLRDLGLPDARLRTILPGVDHETFNPRRRDVNLWVKHGVSEPRRLLYAGRISVEKNLTTLVTIFRQLWQRRRDVALVVAGEGPYLARMRQELADLPAYFLGRQEDLALASLYAGSDLFVFPSRTDTLGQVVLEAQSCGLPALVGNEGGPKEHVEHDVTGLVIGSSEPQAWCEAIGLILDDEPRRLRMSHAAAQRAQRSGLGRTFESFWADHVAVVEPPNRDEQGIASPPQAPARV
jgi:glycosyltransferase involved in cell wall biosynthesis/predicted metal-dependent phosphoesterase TrpH